MAGTTSVVPVFLFMAKAGSMIVFLTCEQHSAVRYSKICSLERFKRKDCGYFRKNANSQRRKLVRKIHELKQCIFTGPFY